MSTHNYFSMGQNAGHSYCDGKISFEEVERSVATLPENRPATWFKEEFNPRGRFWEGFWSSTNIYDKKTPTTPK